MPPKAPNLKFKPKLVLREGDATVRAPAPQSTDDLSLVQLARLQGLYVDEEGVKNANTASTAQQQQQQQQQQQSQTPASASGHGGGGGSSGRGGGGGGGGGGRSGGGGGGGGSSTGVRRTANDDDADEASGTAALLRPKTGRSTHLSAHAALEEASRRHVDLSDFPEAAPPLPVNSMNTIVSPAMTRQGAALHTALYPPLPLDASLPSRLAAQESELGSAMDAPVTGAKGTSATTATAVAGAAAEGAPLNVDGTAFLREAQREQQMAYEANTRFYEEHLRPTQQTATGAGAAATSFASASTGELIWMQIPRFHENPPFSFMDLPPGKVGELKVLRSGRMVMEVAGVYYDVAVEGYDEVGNDGACAMAVATQPSNYPADPSSKASCYELGLLQKKLICTPTLE